MGKRCQGSQRLQNLMETQCKPHQPAGAHKESIRKPLGPLTRESGHRSGCQKSLPVTVLPIATLNRDQQAQTGDRAVTTVIMARETQAE